MALPARSPSPPAHLRLVAPEPPEPSGLRALSPSDAELVARCQEGSREAFELLYRRHAPYAVALAVRVQGHPADVEDILHDAFVRVHGRLASLRSGEAFRPWLSSIIVSLVRSRLRRRRLLGSLGLSSGEPVDLDALVANEAGPSERMELAEVYAALRRVPIDQRIAWTLRYVEGQKLEEVAASTACSLATAKRRILGAQQALLAALHVRPRGFDFEAVDAAAESRQETRVGRGRECLLPEEGSRT